MKVLVYKDYDAMSRAAGWIVASEILSRKSCTLGLATGSTPIGLYKELIRMNGEGLLDFSDVRTYNLDEYIGLSPDHPQSYRRFMDEQLFDHINIDKANTHVPTGIAKDMDAACLAYERQISAGGGIDLQVLGIGSDGHIGFNEPDDHFAPITNCVKLLPQTISDNKRFFEKEEDVPRMAISMGIGTIMKARKIILLANGAKKAKAMYDFLKGPITPQMPASALRLRDNVIVLLDAAAAGRL